MTEPTDETIRAIAEAALRDIYMHVAKAAHAASTRAGWIACRDAAADEVDCGCSYREQAVAATKHSRFNVCQQGECLARLAAAIRALTPPEPAP